MRLLRLCSMLAVPPGPVGAPAAPGRPDLAAEVLALSRALDRLGVVQVVSTRRGGTGSDARVGRDGRVAHPLPARGLRRLPGWPAGLLAPRLAAEVDLVHAHVHASLAEVPAAARAARARRLPLVLTVHPAAGPSPRRPVTGADAADVVLVPTAELRDRLRADGVVTDIRVVPDPEPGPPSSGGGAAGTARDRAGSPPRVAAVAALQDGRRLDVLLHAVAAVPGLTLVLGGEGPQWATLRRLAERLGIAKRVELAGRVADGDLPGLLAGADALVVPPADDATATLLAGMRAGLPVVALDAAASGGLVRHEQDGLLAPGGDAAALAGTLGRLLADPELAGRLSRAGRLRAAGYDWDQVAAQVLPVYEETLARAAVPAGPG